MRQIEIRRRTFIHIYDACEAKVGKDIRHAEKYPRKVSPLNCSGDQDIINNHAGLARRGDSVVNVFRTNSRCLFPRKRNYGNVNFLQRESNVPGKVGRINYFQALISANAESSAESNSFFLRVDLFFFYFIFLCTRIGFKEILVQKF